MAILAAMPTLAAECRPETSFHPASHAAERSLDRLIATEASDPNMILFELKRPDRDKGKDKAYQGLFTPALEGAWARAEATLVRRTCGSKYSPDGEICGMDSSPLSCAQDISDQGYLYRTDCLTKTSATITLRWPSLDQPVATYRLIRQGKGWLLDGVTCRSGGTYNMP
jgi:hypothetical protein